MADYSEKRAGNYTIGKKLGDGGFATVYLAQHTILEKKAAVKFLLEDWVDEQDVVNRFFDEARTMERLKDHDNIVKILDISTVEKCSEEGLPPYFIMEYVEGKSLEEYIKEDEGFTLEDIAKITTCALSALQHCHDRGVVHRDIKPSNIMITSSGEVKLTDFGIAKARINTSKTGEGLTLGSTDYMSPEQALGKKDLDHRSDIYSLGVTLYQMVCDRLPFIGDSPNEVALKHIQEKLVSPMEINDAVPKRLNDIIVKAMEKEKEHRFQSCDEMIKAIKNLDGPEPEIEADINAVDLTQFDNDETGQFLVSDIDDASHSHATTRKFIAKPPPALIHTIRILLIIFAFTGLFLGAFKLYNVLVTAQVTVISEPPGALITLNGEQVGTAPVVLPLPPMGYRVTLSNEGYEDTTVYYDIKPRETRQIRRTLKKIDVSYSDEFASLKESIGRAMNRVPNSAPKTKKELAKLNELKANEQKEWGKLFALLDKYSQFEELHEDFVNYCQENKILDKAAGYYKSRYEKKTTALFYTFAGIVYEKEGNRKKALDLFMLAWTVDNNDRFLLNTLGDYFSRGKDKQKAIQYYKMSLFLYPEQKEIKEKILQIK